MTLGQRIQELRKARGLSQEGLGDRLGVSRQAISKWESDITIPEVDKLVAISRQFNISVGALLGVEENCPQPEQELPHELTERELAAVEAIVNRYLEQLEQTRPKPQSRPEKSPRRWKWAAVVLAVLLVISWSTVSKLNRRIDDLSGQTRTVQDQVSRVEWTVTNQVNGLASRLERLLEAQNSLLSQWECVLTDYIPNDKAVFSLTATPKEYVPGMTADFCVENDVGERVSVPAQWDGTAFTAQMDVPLWDLPKFSIELNDGQSRKTQPMEAESSYMLKSRFGLYASEGGYMQTTRRLTEDNLLILDIRFNFSLKTDIPGEYKPGLLHPTRLTAVVWYGDTKLTARNLQLDRWLEDEGTGEWNFDIKGEFPVQGEDTLRVEAIVTDNYGTTTHWDIENARIEYE